MALTAKEIFLEKLKAKIEENPDNAKAVNAVYQFEVTGDNPSTWSVDLINLSISEGAAENPGCTVTISESDLSDIVEGSLNPQMAFMSGKLKVEGDMGLALKLGNVL